MSVTDSFVGIPGDMSKEDAEKAAIKELHGVVGTATGGPVTLSPAAAALLLTLLPPLPEEEETPKKAPAPAPRAETKKSEK